MAMDKYGFVNTIDDLVRKIARLRFQLSRLPEGSPNPNAARQVAQVRLDLHSALGDAKLLLETAISQRIDEAILNLISTPTTKAPT